MIDPAILRRRVTEDLFEQIKRDQITMNRFEVSVKHALSLVPIRFAFQARNYQHFLDIQRIGLRFEKGNVGERMIKARMAAQDMNFTEDGKSDFNAAIDIQ